MPLWILAVCAAIATFIYTVDFIWFVVKAIRKGGEDGFVARIAKLAELLPALMTTWTAVNQPWAPDERQPDRETDSRTGVIKLSGHFDVHMGSGDGYVCTITYGYNEDSLVLEGHSTLSPAFAFFHAGIALVAALEQRGDLPTGTLASLRDPTPQDAPGSQEP